MAITIVRDILTVPAGIIIHQTNTKGKMGAGLALQIKNKWPHVFEQYQQLCKQVPCSSMLMGKIQTIPVAERLLVCNMFAQDDYGRDKQYTSYEHMKLALQKIIELPSRIPCCPLFFLPYNVGCGLAGGDWLIVRQLIEECLPNAIICKFPA